ncbi:unnamed protein product [Moneuplotes crassus]|uniref:Uncharacterized protein n=1 Tax=Euplotes crassus TaxID=5936 RepID=A0AAD1XSD3_EUPCR|nr:unnamed protein product [Moneuplotes crassus]
MGANLRSACLNCCGEGNYCESLCKQKYEQSKIISNNSYIISRIYSSCVIRSEIWTRVLHLWMYRCNSCRPSRECRSYLWCGQTTSVPVWHCLAEKYRHPPRILH